MSRPSDTRDFVTFHQLRVQAKQLRYTLELLKKLGTTDPLTNLYPMICEIQQQLGQLNNHVVAASRLSQDPPAQCNPGVDPVQEGT